MTNVAQSVEEEAASIPLIHTTLHDGSNILVNAHEEFERYLVLLLAENEDNNNEPQQRSQLTENAFLNKTETPCVDNLLTEWLGEEAMGILQKAFVENSNLLSESDSIRSIDVSSEVDMVMRRPPSTPPAPTTKRGGRQRFFFIPPHIIKQEQQSPVGDLAAEDLIRVDLPSGELKLHFVPKSQPPIVSRVERHSPLASWIRPGQVVLQYIVPNNTERLGTELTGRKLVQQLYRYRTLSTRILIMQQPPKSSKLLPSSSQDRKEEELMPPPPPTMSSLPTNHTSNTEELIRVVLPPGRIRVAFEAASKPPVVISVAPDSPVRQWVKPGQTLIECAVKYCQEGDTPSKLKAQHICGQNICAMKLAEFLNTHRHSKSRIIVMRNPTASTSTRLP